MAGSRPLTPHEQRRLVRRCRRLNARNWALICAQLFLGFRISEIPALTIGHVVRDGAIARRISLPPRLLKGGYGTTRSVPVGPKLARALEAYLRRRGPPGELRPEAPLFLSRERGVDGVARPLCRSSAEKIIKRVLLSVAPDDPFGLSTHSLRKSWATRLYEESDHDLLCVRDALGHSSVAVTQVYLPVDRRRVDNLIFRSDWTRARQRVTRPVPSPVAHRATAPHELAHLAQPAA